MLRLVSLLLKLLCTVKNATYLSLNDGLLNYNKSGKKVK
jgi:hypothetical protein